MLSSNQIFVAISKANKNGRTNWKAEGKLKFQCSTDAILKLNVFRNQKRSFKNVCGLFTDQKVCVKTKTKVWMEPINARLPEENKALELSKTRIFEPHNEYFKKWYFENLFSSFYSKTWQNMFFVDELLLEPKKSVFWHQNNHSPPSEQDFSFLYIKKRFS